MKRLAILFFVCSSAWAGPYIKVGIDYNPRPTLEWNDVIDAESGAVISRSRTEASNYVGLTSVGWRWDFSGVLGDRGELSIKLKALEHRSDPLNSGGDDVVSSNGYRGISIEYSFW